MLNFLLWVIVGGSAGWLANRLLRSATHRETGLNILTGIEGATLGGLVLSPLFGVNPISRTLSAPALLIALGGAFLLLGGVNWFRRRRVWLSATGVSNLPPINAPSSGSGLALNPLGYGDLSTRSSADGVHPKAAWPAAPAVKRADSTCLPPERSRNRLALATRYPVGSAEAKQPSPLQKAKRQPQRQTLLAAMTHRAAEVGARYPQTAQRVSELGLLVLTYLDTQPAWREGRQKHLVAVRVIAANLGLPQSSIQAACTRLNACQLVNADWDGTRQSYGIRLDAWSTIERLEQRTATTELRPQGAGRERHSLALRGAKPYG